MELPPNVQNQLMQFQQLQQQLQMIVYQKQQIETQLKEMEKALEEMEKSTSNEVFKMAGGILVKREKEEVKAELTEKIETLKLKITSLGKQEEKMQKRLVELQENLQKNLQGN